MKKLSIFFVAIMLCSIINAQTQPGCYPFPKTISVTGSAEMLVIPDEIYVIVDLKEYKKKGEDKVEIDKIKSNFLAACKTAGIADSNIAVASYDGYNLGAIWRRRRKDPDLLASISYQVKFSNTRFIDALVDGLDDQATNNFYIARVSHSKITEYRRQMKIAAIKAAKEKAQYLAESVNEQVGAAITIEEPQDNIADNVYQKSKLDNNNMYNFSMKEARISDLYADNSSIDYKRISVRYEVKVLYALK